ncbi:MAG TPA: cysteine synthase family protein [Chloroflexota bacterium]|nr:cysteine synthase family protein [Chloroflexota bacterium]
MVLSSPHAVGASILDAIGDTPVVELRRINPFPDVRLLAKLEGANPSGSVKDRIAVALADEFERRADSSDYILLEPTSGNTGIALAMVGRVRGYRVVAVMPSNVTAERRRLLEIFGAEIVDSPADRGTNGAIEVARSLDEDPRYWILNQYGNSANPLAHYRGTGPEILRDVPEIDVFVAGLGTGGTLTGVGRRLKEAKPGVRVVAAEPLPGDLVQGLRSLDEGFVPPIFDPAILDAKYLVPSSEAVVMMRRLASEEGIFAGVSSGAIVAAALRDAEHMESGTVVALLPDGGWKYLSGDLWNASPDVLDENLSGAFLW